MDSVIARLDALEQADMIVHSSKGSVPRLKRYLDASSGQVPSNNWTDISPVNSQAKERIGYPTQKPLALLERIIAASSNEGDVILDPFCGCATACVAADKLGRQWVGIDLSPKAVELVNMRLQDYMGGLFHPVFPILGAFRLNGQPKRDGSIIVRSCKATQSPVYPIRDAVLAVNHASCPSLSSSGPPRRE